jgi:hypothetical protein
VSVHPSGFYLLVGLSDKLRLFSVAQSDLILLREFHIPGSLAPHLPNHWI